MRMRWSQNKDKKTRNRFGRDLFLRSEDKRTPRGEVKVIPSEFLLKGCSKKNLMPNAQRQKSLCVKGPGTQATYMKIRQKAQDWSAGQPTHATTQKMHKSVESEGKGLSD